MTDVSNKAEGHSSEILRQEKDRIHLKRQMAGVEERMQSLKRSGKFFILFLFVNTGWLYWQLYS